MWLRFAVLGLGTAYVVYRVRLAYLIGRARRAGDAAREQQLRRSSLNIFKWFAVLVLVVVVLFSALVTLNSR